MKVVFKKMWFFTFLFVAMIGLFVGCSMKTNKKSITLYVDGEVYATVEVISGWEIELPENPQKEGWAFDGWYQSEEGKINERISVNPSTDEKRTGRLPVDADTHQAYYAVFEKLSSTFFDAQGGVINEDSYTQTDDKYLIYTKTKSHLSFPIPEKEGHIFLGWKDGDTFVYEHENAEGDESVQVKWDTKEFVADGNR